ncbi:MAG: hypothetical protein HY262_07430, partial [Chloroflexi bacterium]|nr:hypothetical protein [Chloroflexota bacterium]
MTRPLSTARPMIRRSGDRAVTSAGVRVAAGLLGLAGVSVVRAALGGTIWLPLHLALAGAAGTAIASVLPFFTTTLGKAAPAPGSVRVAAVGLVAGGTLLAGYGMSSGQPGVAAIGGASYIAGLGATAAAAFLPLRKALGFRIRLVELAYLAAIAEVVLGVAMATAMLAGWAPVAEAWGSLKPAHAWLNVFGFVTVVVAASLTHLAPTVAGGRIRPRRSASVALAFLMLGAPLVAIGFATGWDPIGRGGAIVELLGGAALTVHGAAVQRDRGRWTSDAGWHRFAGLSLVTAPGWLLIALAISAGRVLWLGPVPAAWDLRLLIVPLVAGWVGQVLVASWTHLVPAVGPGDQLRHAVQRRWLGRASTVRWLAWNAGAALWTVGLPAGADGLSLAGGVA